MVPLASMSASNFPSIESLSLEELLESQASQELQDQLQDDKIALANILAPGVYREPIAWRPSDYLFPLLEPILAFGGATSYFLIAIAAKKKHFGPAAFLAAIQALCLAIANASEESELLRRARKVYCRAAQRALPTLKFLDPEPPYRNAMRPQCLLVIPHGLFCIAGKRYFSEALCTGRQKVGQGWCFFVDEKLCALSPQMKASARMCGCGNIYPVGNKHVLTAMKKNENCTVFPGGFVEASCTSTTCLRLNTGTYGYWINRCLQYGYDICVAMIYHGGDVWEHGEAFFESRLKLAKSGLPGILPTHPRRTPLAVRELFYSPRQMAPGTACASAARDLEETIIQDLAAAYSADAPRVLELTGKPLKRLEIIREERAAASAPSNLSRL